MMIGRHNLFMLTFPSSPAPRAAPSRKQLVWSWRAPKVNFLPPRQELNSLLFLKSSAHASGAWRHSHLLVPFPIWDFYFDISEWHILSACAWTPVLMVYLTNLCSKRKVLILTKLQGKIYKTNSLRHYIANVNFHTQIHTYINRHYLGKVSFLVWFLCLMVYKPL